MWRPSFPLSGLALWLAAVPAQASFLDTDFWCRTYGCAVVHDGRNYDIYDVWQFDTSSCCVLPGGEMIAFYGRAGTPLVTDTLDLAGPGPGAGESLMLNVSGGAAFTDDGDGVLDASDMLAAFALDTGTALGLADDARRYSHSLYISSRNTRFSLRGFARAEAAEGGIGARVGLGDIRLTPALTPSGNDQGWRFGELASVEGIEIADVRTLGDLAAGPTPIATFGRARGIRLGNGDINAQVLRLDLAYELPPYDLSMGTGELAVDVEFTMFREP